MSDIIRIIIGTVTLLLVGCMGEPGPLEPINIEINGCIIDSEYGFNYRRDKYILSCSDIAHLDQALRYRFERLVLKDAVNAETFVLGDFVSLGGIVVENANIKHLDLSSINSLSTLEIQSEHIQSIVTQTDTSIGQLSLNDTKSLVGFDHSTTLIKTLDLSGELNPSLPIASFFQHKEISTLNINSSSIKFIDIDLGTMAGLWEISLAKANIQNLNLSNNVLLRKVALKSEHLQRVRLPEVETTTYINLTLDNLQSLKELHISPNIIPHLSVYGAADMGAEINNLLVEGLNNITLRSTPLAGIDFSLGSELSRVKILEYDDYKIDFSSIPSNAKLELLNNMPAVVDLSEAKMSSIKMTAGSAKTIILPAEQDVELMINSHQTASLSLSGENTKSRIKITDWITSASQLESIDTTDLPGLFDFEVSYATVETLDFTKNNAMQYLTLNNSPIHSLQIADVNTLEAVEVSDTKLTCEQLRSLFAETIHWEAIAKQNESLLNACLE